MTRDSFMIDARLIPDDDHALIVAHLCTMKGVGTVRSYFNTHRLALGALAQFNAELLQIPIRERFSGCAAHIIVTSLEDHLRPIDVVSTTRQIRHVLKSMTGVRFSCFDVEIDRVRNAEENADVLIRSKRVKKAVDPERDFPVEHAQALDRLAAGKRKDGIAFKSSVVQKGREEYLQFLGVLERARMPWRDMDPHELVGNESLDVLAQEWCSNEKGVRRVNQLVHVLGVMFPHLTISSAAEIMQRRCERSSEERTTRKVKTNVGMDKVPLEDLERFAFACPEYAAERGMTRYSPNEVEFEFGGRCVELVKDPTRVASQEGYFAALRAMITTLLESAPHMVDLPTDSRNYKDVAELYSKRYQEYQPSSYLARMESLYGLLIRITSPDTDLSYLRDMNVIARKAVPKKPTSVADISPERIRDLAIA